MSTFIFTYVFLSNGINIIRNLIIMFFVVQPFANVESLLHIMFLLRNSFCKYCKCGKRACYTSIFKEKVPRNLFEMRTQDFNFEC